MRPQPAGVGFGFVDGVTLVQRLGRAHKVFGGLRGRRRLRACPTCHGIMGVFRWAVWLLRGRMTSRRLASGSSLLTKSREVMSPRVTRSSALRMYAGV